MPLVLTSLFSAPHQTLAQFAVEAVREVIVEPGDYNHENALFNHAHNTLPEATWDKLEDWCQKANQMERVLECIRVCEAHISGGNFERLFAERVADKCITPCTNNSQQCSCRRWAQERATQ